MSPSPYSIITPARNEADRIGLTIAAVAAQTHPPSRWIVVDDGSSDETATIVEAEMRRLPFLRLVRRGDRGFDAVGGGVVAAFNDGLAALDVKVPYFGKLDADIEVNADYYERLVRILDAEPKLGIASGQNYLRGEDGALRIERHLPFHPVGGARLYRSEAFDDIGGLTQSPGWDSHDVLRARMHGWETRTYDELEVVHVRQMGTRGALRDGVRRRGRAAYLLGYSRLYMAARIGWYAVTEKPRVRHAWWMLQGYMQAALKREQRIVSAEEMRWYRRFQVRSLLRGFK
jgi:poly-beta-1,6-N-acetyl-D-glucosamine synthase